MKILHCPTAVGGNAPGLAKAERSIGVTSISIAYMPTKFGHEPDKCLWTPEMSRIRKECLRWKLLLKAFFFFDVIHYNYGSTILKWQNDIENTAWIKRNSPVNLIKKFYFWLSHQIEKSLLKRKVIVVTLQGDDIRQKDYSLRSFKYSIAQSVDEQYYPKGSDSKKRELIKKLDLTADVIFSLNPDLLHLLPSRALFLPYAHINLDEWPFFKHPNRSCPLIIHAPSHQGAKGTQIILKALEELKAEGVSFDFKLVENMCITEARFLYEQCDLVIDQLLAGWYGAFAVEAMALGKPVICYIRDSDTNFVKKEMMDDFPIINANPDTIKSVLREYLVKKIMLLPKIGIKSRRYVEKWHNPQCIASELVNIYYKKLISKGRSGRVN